MHEAETYARMDKAYRILRLQRMDITANTLKEAMDDLASEFNARTDEDLPTMAKEYVF